MPIEIDAPAPRPGEYRRRARERADMPSLGDLAEAWMKADRAVVEVELPGLRAWWIGWGEPICFACGWLPPVPDGRMAWFAPTTNSWLERAHLVDHCRGGSSDWTNVVPLCILCHDAMPSFGDRDNAIAWVREFESTVQFPSLWNLWTDCERTSGASDRRTRIQRLRADFNDFMLAVMQVASPSEIQSVAFMAMPAIQKHVREERPRVLRETVRAILAAAQNQEPTS